MERGILDALHVQSGGVNWCLYNLSVIEIVESPSVAWISPLAKLEAVHEICNVL